jgi:hypothetical protein
MGGRDLEKAVYALAASCRRWKRVHALMRACDRLVTACCAVAFLLLIGGLSPWIVVLGVPLSLWTSFCRGFTRRMLKNADEQWEVFFERHPELVYGSAGYQKCRFCGGGEAFHPAGQNPPKRVRWHGKSCVVMTDKGDIAPGSFFGVHNCQLVNDDGHGRLMNTHGVVVGTLDYHTGVITVSEDEA